MNSYPWFIDNWKASEHRARLSPLARCVYRELIDSCWQYGSIPQDAKTLASLSAVTLKQFSAAWVEIESLFVSKNDRYHHPTVDRKRSQFIESKEKLSDAGKKGAAKRYSQATSHPTSRTGYEEANGLASGHPTSRDPNGLANGLAIAPTSYLLLPTEREAVVEAPKQTRAHVSTLDLADAFEPIWIAYPAKGRIKRPEAERQFWEWLAPHPAEVQAEMIAKLAHSISGEGPWPVSQNWVDGFIPGLSEFIRLRRFLEEPPAWVPRSGGRKQHNLVDLGGPDPYADLAK